MRSLSLLAALSAAVVLAVAGTHGARAGTVYDVTGDIGPGPGILEIVPLSGSTRYTYLFLSDAAWDPSGSVPYVYINHDYDVFLPDGSFDYGNSTFAFDFLSPAPTSGGVAGSFQTLPDSLYTHYDDGGYRIDSWSSTLWFDLSVDPSGIGTPYRFILTAVPEPSVWAMMLLGMFGLGAALRARRRVPSAA